MRVFVLLSAKSLSAGKRNNAKNAEKNLLTDRKGIFAVIGAGKRMKEEKNITASAIRCTIRAPSPQACGYKDWETVREAAEKYPHLRPCPKKNWWWIYRKNCLECENQKGENQ